MEPVPLDPVDSVSVTVLVDNVTDLLLLDEVPAIRPPVGGSTMPRRPAPLLETGETVDGLRAEHGFSALVSVTKGEREHRILFDAGVTPDGLIENMRRLQLSPQGIETIVLSHGHFDHTTGMDGLVKALGRANVPVLIHPEFWSRRRVVIPGRSPLEMPSTSKSALEASGFQIVEEEQPSFLLDGSVLVTGEVDRTTEFEQGFPIHEARRDGEWQPDPLILDDQALVVNVRGKGLVVLTGCGHSGIINILTYIQRLTDERRLHALVGGFHLSGPLFEWIIEPTCRELDRIAPDYLAPAHCTGWRATHALAAHFPHAFLHNAVGTRYEFEGS